ncbi:MAG: hypothetical protein IC227_00975 [Enterococcus lacertideformus]|uniref:Lipoprotein n=1 Tax=Enterococcus lacertideformus TaxID=2771493 RepID=A0A931AUV3_9ENTE|nr:hypothetical protein [Enterococcus lacertideformus]
MKKIGYLVTLLALSALVGGCESHNKTESTYLASDSTQLSSSKDISQSSSNNSTTKYLHGLEIGIGEITTADNKKDTKVVSIKVNVRNRSNEEQGVGSNDFRLKIRAKVNLYIKKMK